MALKGVDRTRPAPADEHSWKFWVPDPSTLVRYHNTQRVESYIQHWLQLRQPWLARLQALERTGSAPSFRSKQWTDLLDTGILPGDTVRESQTSTRRLVNVARFTSALGEHSQCVPGDPRWYGRDITAVSERDALQITWEIASVGFRMELRALDRQLVKDNEDANALIDDIFANKPLVLETLPTDGEGLAARTVAGRARSLEALRRLQCRWPSVPEVIATAAPVSATSACDVVAELEHAMATFYVQTFWDVAGRAALDDIMSQSLN